MKLIKWLLLIIVVIAFSLAGFKYSQWFKRSAVKPDVENAHIYIKSNSSLDDLYNILEEKDVLKSIDDFKKLAALKGNNKPKPGHYIIKNGQSTNQLVNIFTAGLQSPVKLVINPVRTPEALAGKISSFIELDSATVLNALRSSDIAKKYDFKTNSFYTIFLPDTYEVYWNISLNSLLERMDKEYNNFWDSKRKEKAKKLNLTPKEVTTLASIVLSEQLKHSDERPTIAGLYLNRLRKGIPLQSDPTLIYAKGDFTIRRVLNEDKKIDSPYNTYMYKGLPPGPIYSPDKSSIDAVLNAESNRYLYMCAKPDNSGYHAFATSLSQHNKNARKYQRWISSQGIYR